MISETYDNLMIAMSAGMAVIGLLFIVSAFIVRYKYKYKRRVPEADNRQQDD